MFETQGDLRIGKRPLIITIICILNFIGYALSFLSLVIPEERAMLVQRAGTMMVPIAFAICILAFVGMVGYWKMRKWGVWIYLGMAIINFGSDLLFRLRLSQTGIIQYSLIILVIIIGFIYFDRMT